MTAVKQYPMYMERYAGGLVQAMAIFLMAMFTKKDIFIPWTKKTITLGVK